MIDGLLNQYQNREPEFGASPRSLAESYHQALKEKSAAHQWHQAHTLFRLKAFLGEDVLQNCVIELVNIPSLFDLHRPKPIEERFGENPTDYDFVDGRAWIQSQNLHRHLDVRSGYTSCYSTWVVLTTEYGVFSLETKFNSGLNIYHLKKDYPSLAEEANLVLHGRYESKIHQIQQRQTNPHRLLDQFSECGFSIPEWQIYLLDVRIPFQRFLYGDLLAVEFKILLKSYSVPISDRIISRINSQFLKNQLRPNTTYIESVLLREVFLETLLAAKTSYQERQLAALEKQRKAEKLQQNLERAARHRRECPLGALPASTFNALKRYGVQTMEELTLFTVEELAQIPGIGQKGISSIQRMIVDHSAAK